MQSWTAQPNAASTASALHVLESSRELPDDEQSQLASWQWNDVGRYDCARFPAPMLAFRLPTLTSTSLDSFSVSQASPLRRVHVKNELLLYEYQPPYGAAGYASGGYVGNSRIDGQVTSGSQQQFMTRSTELNGGWMGGVWNMVFAGCPGAPASHCSNSGGSPYSTVSTITIAEKPFITVDSTGKYWLNVPDLRPSSTGPDWSPPSTRISFDNVYVANNETDTAKTINAALSGGAHVIMAPGIYSLSESINVVMRGQVLMGLGFPTLVSATGNPVISVGNVDSVRIAGPFLLQAGPNPTDVLMQWGDGT